MISRGPSIGFLNETVLTVEISPLVVWADENMGGDKWQQIVIASDVK
jgi:hypothetical protein